MKSIINFILIFLLGCTGLNTFAREEKTMQAIKFVEKKLSKIKGYTAEVERRVLDVNGGFNEFSETQIVRSPNKMVVNGKTVAAHNRDRVGQSFIFVINDGSLYTRVGKRPVSKNSFKRYEESGGPSLRLYMAYLGNLLDPFFIYNSETLKLQDETEEELIFTAKYKKLSGMPYWLPRWTNRITIDKKNGFIKKVEALITEQGGSVILLNVKEVSLSDNSTDESIFNIENIKEKEVDKTKGKR